MKTEYAEVQDKVTKRLEDDVERVMLRNTNAVFQQYLTISDENKKFGAEIHEYKYKMMDMNEKIETMSSRFQAETEAKNELEIALNRVQNEFSGLSVVPAFSHLCRKKESWKMRSTKARNLQKVLHESSQNVNEDAKCWSRKLKI